MTEIKLNCRLKAYTRGIYSGYLTDAPKDDKLYARKNGQWEVVEQTTPVEHVKLAENGGLKFNEQEELLIKQWAGDSEDFEYIIVEDDTTYYIADNTPEVYVNGGTVFSEGNNDFIDNSEYSQVMNGGLANTNQFDLVLEPINSKGEKDDSKNTI